jgi:hypothetical protein
MVPTVAGELAATLYEFVEGEGDPCRFDHHGYCQEHGYFGEPGDCHVRRGRELLGLDD